MHRTTIDLIKFKIIIITCHYLQLIEKYLIFKKNPVIGCTIQPAELVSYFPKVYRVELLPDDIIEYHKANGSIEGPIGTPYEGGIFVLDIKFKHGYPFQKVECCFLTNIYHPNINSSGVIAFPYKEEEGNPNPYRLTDLLQAVRDLLISPMSPNPDKDARFKRRYERLKLDIPFAEFHRTDRERIYSILSSSVSNFNITFDEFYKKYSAIDFDYLVPEVAFVWLNDREKYNYLAKEWTRKYAT